MSHPKRILIFCICSLHVAAQNFEAVYSFANVTNATGTVAPGPLPEVTGIAFASFTAFGLPANPNASGRFSFTGWPTGAQNGEDAYENFSGTLSPFSFYEVSLTVQSGYTLNLQNISFSVRRSGTGIRNYCVRSDQDNYNTNLAASTGSSEKLSVLPGDVFFWNFDGASTTSDQHGSEVQPGTTHNTLTGEVHFRFYAWNAEAGGGSFSIDNVRFKGSLSDSSMISTAVKEDPEESCLLTVRQNHIDLKCDCRQVMLFDAFGNLLFQADCTGNELVLSTGELPHGIYFLITSGGRGYTTQKILIRPG